MQLCSWSDLAPRKAHAHHNKTPRKPVSSWAVDAAPGFAYHTKSPLSTLLTVAFTSTVSWLFSLNFDPFPASYGFPSSNHRFRQQQPRTGTAERVPTTNSEECQVCCGLFLFIGVCLRNIACSEQMSHCHAKSSREWRLAVEVVNGPQDWYGQRVALKTAQWHWEGVWAVR